MRVLFLIHDTAISGAAISLFNLLEGLKAKGVDIHIAGPHPSTTFRARTRDVGATYYDVHPAMSVMPPYKAFRNLLGFPKNFLKLINNKMRYYLELNCIVKIIQPDIIHTNVGILHEGLKVARKYKIPHIIHLREYQDLDFNWNFYPSKILFEKMLRSTNVICISEDIRKYFNLQDYSSCITIYNGILHEKDARLIAVKDKYFMTASRISPEKDIALTIRAFSIFAKSNSDYILRVFGEGAEVYTKELKQLTVDLGINTKVIFEGYKPNIPDYLERATAIIVSSRNEGFGRMSAEAAIKGCILIGRDSGGTKEIMDKIKAFPFSNIDECAIQMRKVVSLTAQEYKNIVRIAQKGAVTLFSIEQNVQSVYNFYKKICLI